MIFNLFLLIIIIFLLFVLSMVWPPDSPWAPWWRTNSKTARAMCKLAKIKKGEMIYDLGSGDGTALVIAAKEFNAKGVGIEIDAFRYFISKINFKLNKQDKNLIAKRKNFFDEDLKNADIVFIYLVPTTLKKLLPKLKKELRKGTRIVSYVYKMDLPLTSEDKKNKIRLYTI